MADRTTNLALPFILPSQAQKHVTHNEALLALDALVQLTILDELPTPAASAEDGDCYLVAEAASGAWSGKAGQIATWQNGGWSFHQPLSGWRAWFCTDGSLRVFWEGAWRSVLPVSPRLEALGINADGDATNRLAVASPASLFDHAGNGHQLKINKAGANDTASLLFQAGYIGHAELGLAGENAFSVKVSDGTTWRTALSIDPDGRHSRPHQPAMRAYRAGTNMSPADGQLSGFTHFGVSRGGFTLGNALAGGGGAIAVPASGSYQASLQVRTASTSGHVTSLAVNGTPAALRVAGASGSSETLSAGAVIDLVAGDLLSLHHAGGATILLGDGNTQLSLAML